MRFYEKPRNVCCWKKKTTKTDMENIIKYSGVRYIIIENLSPKQAKQYF